MSTTTVLKKVAAAMLVAGAASANAVPVSVAFNFVPFGGTLTGNGIGGDITSSTFVSYAGGSYLVSGIDSVATTNNIGIALSTVVNLTNPMPLTLGSVFTKTFQIGATTFTETLTVDSVAVSASSRSITAFGTIDDGAGGFDPTSVFFSASYTQNGGPGGQINVSFNNSTVPPTPPTLVPEPMSLALVGLALAGLGVTTRRRKA